MTVSKFKLFRALILLPGNAMVFVPGALLYLEGRITPAFGTTGIVLFVICLIAFISLSLGLTLAYRTVSLFFRKGEGTPAPWDPPQKLVILGPYRYVRNPMITGALFILIGEILFLGSLYILAWAWIFFIGNHFWFVFFEEKGLEKRFGKSYVKYKQCVPRWIPRLKPYNEGTSTGSGF